MSITFQVSRVERAKAPLTLPPPDRDLRLQGRRVEAMGARGPFLPSHGHGLVTTVGHAFADHRPLALTPDAIWLAIAQGFAIHVNLHAERLRGRFVLHEGQETIVIRRDDFVGRAAENPWPEVLGAFSDEVAKRIGRVRDLVVCDFSTTGPIERAASEIVLLDAMQRYFTFELHTYCGIPAITLEGTAEDWRSIRRRAQALEEYDLAFWTSALLPVLDAIVATAEGRVDVPFWESFFKYNNQSGGPYISGWINVLFPYLRDAEGSFEQNDYTSRWREGFGEGFRGGAAEARIPSGLSSAPFVWDSLGDRLPMRFFGGFVGAHQDEGTLAVRPAIGWAVGREVVARPATRPPPRSLALIAGRVTDRQEMTVGEMEATMERVSRVTAEMGFPLVCAPAAELRSASKFLDVPVPCRFAIGERVCAEGPCPVDELDAVMARVRAVPEPLWTSVMEGLRGALTSKIELSLVVASDQHLSGEMRFGAAGRARSFVVGQVSTGKLKSCWASINVSPEAHAKRRERARALGAEHGWAQYWLIEP